MYRPAEYNCHHCDKAFTSPQEIYSIRNLILQGDGTAQNQLRWRWARKEDGVEPVDFYFHRECFESIAGSMYVGRRT